MSTDDLKNVLNFVKEQGVCTENQVWKQFAMCDSQEERTRINYLLMRLNRKGLVTHDYSKKGFSIIRYGGIEFQ